MSGMHFFPNSFYIYIHCMCSAKKHSDKLSIIKYDVEGDNNKDLKVELLLQGVMIKGLPTLILYYEGTPLATHSGMITESGLDEWLDNNLFSKMNELNTMNNAANDEKLEQMKEDSMSEEVCGKQRGFVSFDSSGKDDYML